MTRQRTSQYPPRSDPETTISRQFTLPTARTFTLSGSASLSALIPDDEIDRLVGRAAAAATGVRDAYSSGRLPGDLQATASATRRRQPGHGLAARARDQGPDRRHADLRPGQARRPSATSTCR